MKEFHSTRHDVQQRTRKPSGNPPPLGHPPHIRTTATSPTPATRRIIAKKERIDDPKGARGKSTARPNPTIHATQPSSRGSLGDQPPHAYLATVRTTTLKRRLA